MDEKDEEEIKAKTYIITIHLQKLDGKRLLALHEEGKGVATSGKIRLISKELENIIGNITHELITVQLVDRIATHDSPLACNLTK